MSGTGADGAPRLPGLEGRAPGSGGPLELLLPLLGRVRQVPGPWPAATEVPRRPPAADDTGEADAADTAAARALSLPPAAVADWRLRTEADWDELVRHRLAVRGIDLAAARAAQQLPQRLAGASARQAAAAAAAAAELLDLPTAWVAGRCGWPAPLPPRPLAAVMAVWGPSTGELAMAVGTTRRRVALALAEGRWLAQGGEVLAGALGATPQAPDSTDLCRVLDVGADRLAEVLAGGGLGWQQAVVAVIGQPAEQVGSIGEEITRVREAAALTRAALAAAVGVNHSTVSRWESGKREPPLEVLGAVAVATQAPLWPLLQAHSGAQTPR